MLLLFPLPYAAPQNLFPITTCPPAPTPAPCPPHHTAFLSSAPHLPPLPPTFLPTQANLWPANEAARTGFGWFKPRATWVLPRQLRTCKAMWVGRLGEG